MEDTLRQEIIKLLQGARLESAWQLIHPMPDEALFDLIDDLRSVQKHLRAKHWQRAVNALPDASKLSADEQEQLAGLSLTTLKDDIASLKESNQALERRRSAAALEVLAGIDSPILEAEKLCQQGTAYIFEDELERAEAHFQQALSLDPQHYRVITNRANIYLEQGDTEQAITLYEQALEVQPNFSNALHNLGVAHRKQGNIAKGVNYLKKSQRSLKRVDENDARGELGRRGFLLPGRQARVVRWIFLVIILFFLWPVLRGMLP